MIDHSTGEHSFDTSGVMSALPSADVTIEDQKDVFDLPRLAHSLGGAAASEVVKAFAAYAGDVLSELKHCVRRHDAGQARLLARELKGSCVIVGAARMMRCLHLLDGAFDAADRENIEVCVDNLHKETNRLKRAAAQLK